MQKFATIFLLLMSLQSHSGQSCRSDLIELNTCEECQTLGRAVREIQVHEECDYWSRLGNGFAAYVGKQTMSCLCGIGNSHWNIATGIFEMARHPIQTYRAIREMIAHPIQSAQAVLNEVRGNVAGFSQMSEEQQAAYMCSSLIHVVLAGNNIRMGVQKGIQRVRRRASAAADPPTIVGVGTAQRSSLTRSLPGAPTSVLQRNGRYYIEQTLGGRKREVMISEEVALQIQSRGTITVYRATHYAEELSDVESGNPLSTWAQRHGGKTVDEVHSEIRNLHQNEAALSQRIREHGGHTNESPFISTTTNRAEAVNNFGRHPDAKIMKFEIPVDEILVGNQSEWEILFQGPVPSQYFKGFE